MPRIAAAASSVSRIRISTRSPRRSLRPRSAADSLPTIARRARRTSTRDRPRATRCAAGAIRQRAVEQPSRQVPDRRHARRIVTELPARGQKEVVAFLGRCASSAAASAGGSCAPRQGRRRGRPRRRSARRCSTSWPDVDGREVLDLFAGLGRARDRGPVTRRRACDVRRAGKPALATLTREPDDARRRGPRDRGRR